MTATPAGGRESKGLLGRVAGAVTERVVDTVDPHIVLERMDLNTLLAGVDVDALLRNVDLEALVRRSGIPDIVAESTYSMAGSALDVARRQLVGLDVVADRIVDKLMRRSEDQRLEGPPRLVR